MGPSQPRIYSTGTAVFSDDLVLLKNTSEMLGRAAVRQDMPLAIPTNTSLIRSPP